MRMRFRVLALVALSVSTRCNAQSLIPAANCETMEDVPGFIDFEGYTCEDYGNNETDCATFGNSPGAPPHDDITANEACIVCGACQVCTDEIDWQDQYDNTCDHFNNDTAFEENYGGTNRSAFLYDDGYYEINNSFCNWAQDENKGGPNNSSAGVACCACGGGNRQNVTRSPSDSPSSNPSLKPSALPTSVPSSSPSISPSSTPSNSPSALPSTSISPSSTASNSPSVAPTAKVVAVPTISPTRKPTKPTKKKKKKRRKKWRKKMRKKRRRKKKKKKKKGKMAQLFGV